MSAALSRQARLFARHQQRVQLETLLSDPLSRPSGWVILIGSIPTAAMIWFSTAAAMAPLAAAIVSYVVALAVVSGAWMAAGWIAEARAFRRAPYRWLLHFGSTGAAGAYARLDRKQRLTVYSIWATPRGQGYGSMLIDRIIDDTAGAELWLVADNRRAASLYRRHGFEPVRRELLGQRMVLHRGRKAAEEDLT